ncbi:MAG TPA: hypothetical protein VFL04_06305, partial [Rectinemataceae bacterium]|nr:hypothetical protein [Rectinemataceae bacterium]
ACQAVDLRGGPEGLSPSTAAAYRLVRSAVPSLGADRVMYPDIEAVLALIAEGSLLRAAADHLEGASAAELLDTP